jgi:hypothetical protein
MGHSKLANGNGYGARIGRSASSAQQDQMARRPAGKKVVRKKTASRKANSAPPLRKKMNSEPKLSRLVCRYCGIEDLAPSFIKRRDRRCRKCFSKRYGSAARAEKGDGNEVALMARDQGPDLQGFGLFFFSAKFQCRALAVTDFSAVQSDPVVPAPPSPAPPCAPFSRLFDKINPSFVRRNLSRSKLTVSNLSARRDPVCT